MKPARATLPTILATFAIFAASTIDIGQHPAFSAARTSPAIDASANHDQRLLALSDRFPTFGGLFVEGTSLVVFETVKDSIDASDFRLALATLLGDEFGPDELARLTVEVRDAQFSFPQLKQWELAIANQVSKLGDEVQISYVDDRSNQVHFAVTTPQAQQEIAGIANGAGVPQAALTVEVTLPLSPYLRSDRPALVGGLQISKGIAPSGQCSLGFFAIRNGIRGFVTAHHCTNYWGQVDPYSPPGMPFGQAGASRFAGRETVDPAFTTGIPNCPANFSCRNTDSIFAAKNTSFPDELGRIAWPPQGSYVWNGTSKFQIVNTGTFGAPQPIYKVGRTTGNTAGTSADTCVLRYSYPYAYVCEAVVTNMVAWLGDSGAPMFAVGANGQVTLKGILTSGNAPAQGQPAPIVTVSQINYIRTELGGTWSVCVSTC